MKVLLGCIVFVLLSAATGMGQTFPVGDWQVNASRTLQNQPSSLRTGYDTLPSTSKQRITGSLDSRRFSFASDGSFRLSLTTGGRAHSSSGQWTLTNSQLTLRFSSGESYRYSVSGMLGGDYLLEYSGSNGAIVENLVLSPSN
jgi:hypothetical protein